jgi:hypothetical protein
MIYFNINIRNPYWWDRFENLWCKAGATPFKYKFWEIQILKGPELFRIEFEVTTRQDHAGMNLELGLLGYHLGFTFYDNRHWNTEEGCWMIYTEERGLH